MENLISILKWLHPEEKEDEIHFKILSPYLKLWGFLGLWPKEDDNEEEEEEEEEEERQEERCKSFRYFYPRLLVVFCILTIILIAYSVFNYPHDIISKSEHFVVIIFSGLVAAKVLTYIWQAARIKKLSQDLESCHKGHGRDDDQEVKTILYRACLVSKVFNRHLMIGLLVGISAIGLLMLVAAIVTRVQVFSEKIPFCDVTKSPCFEFIVFHEMMFAWLCMITVDYCNLFFVDILSHTCAEFKILNHNLKNIRGFVEKKVTEMWTVQVLATRDEEEAVAVAKEQLVVPAAVHGAAGTAAHGRVYGVVEGEMLVRNEYTTPVRTIGAQPIADVLDEVVVRWGRVRRTAKRDESEDERRRREEEEEARRRAVDRLMEQRLTECVRHHQTLLRLTGDVQSIFDPFMIFQILSNILGSAFMILYIILVPVWGVKEIMMICVEFCLLTELFAYSWFSNQITKQSSKVRDSLFGSDWLDASDRFKRSMRVIMCRANERLVIRIGGSAPLSLATFKDVSKTAYSYLMAMRTVAHKQRYD